MTFLTGDTHGNFVRVDAFCRTRETNRADTMIVLGDAGFNYHLTDRDTRAKEYASALPVTFFCVHGNHEARPQRLPSYVEGEYHGGKVLYEEAFPDLLFAVDGEVYDFDGYRCIVIGGAYSIDKHIRLARGLRWWPDEQPDEETKAAIEQRLAALNWKIDVVLSHTCPRKYEPTEVFLAGFDQKTADKSTEDWLDGIEDRLDYRKWYCGHYHTRKQSNKMQFMFEDFGTLEDSMELDEPVKYDPETDLPIDKAYLECGLPPYLQISLENMKKSWMIEDGGGRDPHWDLWWGELNADINSAEVDQVISTEQAWYLRETYLRLDRKKSSGMFEE